MEAFLVSLSAITLGEIGDKTQLLALLLAMRFKRPVPITLGIIAAVIANHTLAGFVGHWIGNAMSPHIARWVLGVSLLAVAGWTLIPDKIDEEADNRLGRFGVFGATFVAFFLAEMGDKTQIVTVMLAARFDALFAVVCGTSVGMLIADLPAIYLGQKAAHLIPLGLVRILAALLFATLGILTLLGIGFTG